MDLTEDQKKIVEGIRNEWEAYGTSTEPANRSEAEKAIAAAYREAGFPPPPRFVWVGSPVAGMMGSIVAPAAQSTAEKFARQLKRYSYSEFGPLLFAIMRWDSRWGANLQDVRTEDGALLLEARFDNMKRVPTALVEPETSVGAVMWNAFVFWVEDMIAPVCQGDEEWLSTIPSNLVEEVFGQHPMLAGKTINGPIAEALEIIAFFSTQVREEAGDSWKNRIPGQNNAGFYSFVEAMRAIGTEGLDDVVHNATVGKNAGWWFPFDELCIIAERPTFLSFDGQDNLHNTEGPAILYPDGFGVYVVNGLEIPASIITRGWSVQEIFDCENVEVRRVAIEVGMGWDQFVLAAELEEINRCDDPGNAGAELVLYRIPRDLFPEVDDPGLLLLCRNGTQERDGRWRHFGLTIPSEVDGVRVVRAAQAAAWTYGIPEEVYLELGRRC